VLIKYNVTRISNACHQANISPMIPAHQLTIFW